MGEQKAEVQSDREREWSLLRRKYLVGPGGLEMEPYKEVLGSLHHLAISVPLDTWKHLRVKLETAGIEIAFEHAGSIYFNGPDGERLELLAEPLGEMNGRPVL